MNDSIIHLPFFLLSTASCLPDNVMAELSCNDNTFAVQWRASFSELDTYTAMAIGSDESRATCDTMTTDCVIQNLKCGLSYSIVVTTSSVDCGTIDGSDYKMHSGSKSCRCITKLNSYLSDMDLLLCVQMSS